LIFACQSPILALALIGSNCATGASGVTVSPTGGVAIAGTTMSPVATRAPRNAIPTEPIKRLRLRMTN
jgi:hypothetical protein